MIETELIETELVETERLLLRRYRSTDADRVLDIHSWHRHGRAVAERFGLRPRGSSRPLARQREPSLPHDSQCLSGVGSPAWRPAIL